MIAQIYLYIQYMQQSKQCQAGSVRDRLEKYLYLMNSEKIAHFLCMLAMWKIHPSHPIKTLYDILGPPWSPGNSPEVVGTRSTLIFWAWTSNCIITNTAFMQTNPTNLWTMGMHEPAHIQHVHTVPEPIYLCIVYCTHPKKWCFVPILIKCIKACMREHFFLKIKKKMWPVNWNENMQGSRSLKPMHHAIEGKKQNNIQHCKLVEIAYDIFTVV